MPTTEELIQIVGSGGTLPEPDAEWLLEQLLLGNIATADIVKFLTALNERLPEASELTAFARTIRRHATRVFKVAEPIPPNMVDTCGTGGDGSGTFNISTAAAIVAAGAGARVAKHGNRSSSSRCGSADVLEALGVRVDLALEFYGVAIREVGIGFLFAPTAHTAARHAIPARRMIGQRTVFNLLGPLTNPAGAQKQVLGVYSPSVIGLVAETVQRLGTERTLVVHGAGGLDEFSIAGKTEVAEVLPGCIRRFAVMPEDFGIRQAPLETIRGGTPKENAELILRILEGEAGPHRDVVVMNAAAALVVTGTAPDFVSGTAIAERAICSGAARRTLQKLAEFTHSKAPVQDVNHS